MRFPSTSISLIGRVMSDDPETAKAGWNDFLSAYWYPLYALARCRGVSHHDAADLVQGFISTELLAKSLVDKWRQEKGTLRGFLRTLFTRYCVSEHRRETAVKRGGNKSKTHFSMDLEWANGRYENTAVDHHSPDLLYDKEWAEATVQQAIEALSADYADRGKLLEFQLLCRNLSGGSEDKEKLLYREIAEKLGTTEGNVKQKVIVFRQRFRAALTAVVAGTAEEAEVQGELEYVHRLILGR